MKKLTALLLVLAMTLTFMPVISLGTETTQTAESISAFSWNFETNAQNGTLPTVVSWGNYRAAFMSFEIPEEILSYKDETVIINATLSANMTFNNGRVSGQAPFVTIVEADGDAIASADMGGGSDTTNTLKAAWAEGKVLGTIDTLKEDVSTVMDITEIVKGGKTKIGLYLTCRSEDGYLKTNGIVNFNSPSLEITVTKVDEDYYLNSLNIPYNISEGYILPKSIGGMDIVWSESEIKAEGETVYKKLTASINNKTKDFDVMIMGENDKFIAAYTTEDSVAVGNSMHLAIKTETGWEELNFGIGVLFASADLSDETSAGTTKVLEKPYIYRKDNGKIGVSARCMKLDGTKDEFLTLWETDDLVHFETVGTAENVDGYETVDRVEVEGINGTVSSVFPITDSEYEYLTKKLMEVKNTSVEPIILSTVPGKAISKLPSLTANYSDTSKGEIPVKWNEEELNAIDFNKTGIYTVTGQAQVADYPSPMFYGEADPVIYNYNGKYYFIATNETGSQLDLYIRCADTIDELETAEEVLIFKHTSSGDHSGCNWAPELHVINGELYCLFASSTTGSWNAVQSRIMKCTGDPMNINDWEAPVMVTRKDGSSLIDEGITLDMTYFESKGKHYYAWAERPITSQGNGNSYIAIAEMDPSDPYRITTDPVIIRIPEYGWDRRTTTVDEGPHVLKHEGKIYMSFSGSGCDNTYCLGYLIADEDADLLNKDSWRVTNYPVLASEHVAGEYGPGHNAFAKDEYGRDIIIVHMKPNGGTRSGTVRTIHYGFDGTPILYMTADRYLKSEYRNVTATIYVRDEDVTDEEFELESIVNNLTIHNADNIKEHITLPTEIDGATILWSSDNSAVTNDGVVTRGNEDVRVNLTALVSKNGLTKEKVFTVTIKAKRETHDKVGYIYAYFRGSVNGEKEVQQIHLAISDDGLNWRDLNGNFPVIESKMGTKGLRDPYLIRSYEGDKFYLLATDLDANGGDWTQYGENGSRYLMIWESDDLLNWSEQRMVKVSDENMGCTWAPEAIYDEENKNYLVYWSSHRADLGGKKVVQCATTRDFVTFTEPEIFVGGDGEISVIDTTMIKGDDGKYYRFTKYADKVRVFMEVSDSPTGPFTEVSSNVYDIYGVEGPEIFKLEGTDKYCLMLDSYTGDLGAIGFFPMVTDDLSSGNFTRLTEGYKMPTGAKHGGILAITEDEYASIMKKWGPLPDDENVIEYKFDGSDENLTLYGNAKLEGGTLVLDGTSSTYANLGKGIFDRREKFTVSMDLYNETESGFFFTFSIGDTTSDYLFLRTRKEQVRLAQTISGNTYEEAVNVAVSDNVNKWSNYTIVGDGETLKLYIDGVLSGEANTTKTLYHLGENLSVNLGKSTFSADKYFKGKFENVKIFNRALTKAEVIALLGDAEKHLEYDYDNLSILNQDEITCDLMLPSEGERSGCEITWKSSDTSVITDAGIVNRFDTDKKVTMTGTLTLGETVLEKKFDVTVLAKEEDYAYLFAYFTGSAASQERLFYGVSKDGYNFRALNGGNSVLTSDLGTGCIRDPFIMKGEDGYYYIIATDMKSSLGWSSNYATVVFKTPDLINIVDKEWINYRNFKATANCTRAWAPQAIWCPEKEAYMVYLTMEMPDDDYPTVMFRHYATDLCDASTYTEPTLMLNRPENINSAIDGDIIYDKFHDEYIMFYNGKQLAVSKTLSGEWTHAKTKYSDGQLPMVTSTGASMAVEGSNIWQIIGRDKWVIAADGTAFNGGCYALVETEDFENYTQLWASRGDYSFDFTPRHGYVIPISERELNNLFTAYGTVEFPEDKAFDLNIDLSQKGVDINEDMYGIFYEDINYGADGGLYSEVIENRSFEAAHCNPDKGEAYTKIPSSGWTVTNATAEYLSENPLNENNTTYVRLTTQNGSTLSNECYSGFKASDGEIFDVSFFARGNYTGKITVSIVEGENVLGSKEFTINSTEFKKYSGTLQVKGESATATVKLSFDKEGTIDMDMISVITQNTFNGRNNGLRRDIVQALYDLHPKFMRFPGGCVVEGYYLDNRYKWKESIGPVEERKENWNRWQTGSNAYDYCQTLGLGFYEYFLLCEDIGAKPLPVVSVGIGCQYQSGEVSSWDDLYNIYIQDAIDLIEFANGDPKTNKWAAIRAEMGHEEPFNLEYLGIGNEQWYTDANRFFERYEAFEEEIHKLYPDIKLISTSGPSADGTHYDNAWNWLKSHNGEENFTYAVDEHYYRTPEWFLDNVNRYDSYDREGFGVFAGEYAANGTYGNTLYSAIAEAAYMTGLEKNADIVKLASYAPLLAKEGFTQWSPNLIWFDNTTVYGSPDYYVQKMYSENNGSYTVKNEVSVHGEEKVYKAGVGTWSTAAQFKDITVTDDKTNETTKLVLGETTLGTWTEDEGVYSQTSTSANGAFNIAPVTKNGYTLSLKAMKTGGNEGFLIPIKYVDNNNYIFWNIAGWGNTQSAVQKVDNGTKTNITSYVPIVVETNTWYDVSVKVTEDTMYCYLNGELIQSAFINKTEGPVYSSVSVDEKSGDIIVKLVNSSETKADVNVKIENAEYIAPLCDEYVLTGNAKGDRNSLANPENVREVKGIFTGASDNFTYEMTGLSFVVLRLHTTESYVTEVTSVTVNNPENLPENVLVTLSDGSKEERKVTWQKGSEGAYCYGGSYTVEGDVEQSNVKAIATLNIPTHGMVEFTGDNTAHVYTRENTTVRIAVYNDEGALISIETKKIDGEEDIVFTAPESGKVKIMLWSENITPMEKTFEKVY
ncbi:MAG: family 43 glycosylhydrolase [Clostridia bacterium]